MSNFEDKPPPAVGAYWIREEDYAALLNIFEDGANLPPSWQEWLARCQARTWGGSTPSTGTPRVTRCCNK